MDIAPLLDMFSVRDCFLFLSFLFYFHIFFRFLVFIFASNVDMGTSEFNNFKIVKK